MTISQILDTLADKQDLESAEADAAFSALADGKMSTAQAGGFLLTLRAKGENPQEMAAAVNCVLARARLITGISGDYVDIVGTGGDNKHSFNCSTAAALTVAGLGYKVLKHGNRAVSSSCGAGDVLEKLGYPLQLDGAGIAALVEKTNFGFAFAPNFHPCFKNIAPVRKELGVRTLFNLLGPLVNPSRPPLMMLGVASASLVPAMAEALAKTGHYKRALVIHGCGGYDEVTAFGPATARLVEGSSVKEMEIDPAQLGFAPPARESDLRVESKEEAEAALLAVISGQGNQAMSDMVALNTAVCISLFEPELDRHACVARARKAVADGLGMKTLERLRTCL